MRPTARCPRPTRSHCAAPRANTCWSRSRDINGNTRYDHGEPFAKYGDPTPIDFWAQRDIEGLKLTLSLPVDPDAWSPTRLRERGVEVSERLSDFGQVVTLDDPRFERDIARMGMWEPARFIEENHAGLYTLEEYNPQKIPVVFVHGIRWLSPTL